MKTGRTILLINCILFCMQLKFWLASANCVIQDGAHSDGPPIGSANQMICTSDVAEQGFATSGKKEQSSSDKTSQMGAYTSPKDQEVEPERFGLYNGGEAGMDGSEPERTLDSAPSKRSVGHKFMRFGRLDGDGGMGHKFMRFGRDIGGEGHKFMRFGKGGGGDQMGHKFMRFGRTPDYDGEQSLDITEDDLARILGGGGGGTNLGHDDVTSNATPDEGDDDDYNGQMTFQRMAKDNFKHNFMRFGKRSMYPSDYESRHSDHRKGHNFMRFGRIPEHTFMRFGRK